MTKSPVVIPVEIEPLKPYDINNGFKNKSDNKKKGMNNIAAIFKLRKVFIPLEQCGQNLVLLKLLTALENRLTFFSQCGHFILTSFVNLTAYYVAGSVMSVP